MSNLLFQTIDQISREKGIDPQVVIHAIEDAIVVDEVALPVPRPEAPHCVFPPAVIQAGAEEGARECTGHVRKVQHGHG